MKINVSRLDRLWIALSARGRVYDLASFSLLCFFLPPGKSPWDPPDNGPGGYPPPCPRIPQGGPPGGSARGIPPGTPLVNPPGPGGFRSGVFSCNFVCCRALLRHSFCQRPLSPSLIPVAYRIDREKSYPAEMKTPGILRHQQSDSAVDKHGR